MKAYHPFKSSKDKDTYMAINNKFARDWPEPSECRMVPTSFGETHVRINGPVDAPALILLPGALCCSLSWLLNVESLSLNYRIYAVDTLINTGCIGKSVYRKTITDADNAVKWLDELFDGLKLKSVNIAGMSYGGLLASLYAISFPIRVNKLLLLAPAILPFGIKFVLHAIPLLLKPTTESFRQFLIWHLDVESLENKNFIQKMIEMMIASKFCLETTKYYEPAKLKAGELQKIKAPTFLLVGEKDRSYSVKKAIRSIRKSVPDWKVETLPGVGHGLPMAEPELVNRKILNFLKTQIRKI